MVFFLNRTVNRSFEEALRNFLVILNCKFTYDSDTGTIIIPEHFLVIYPIHMLDYAHRETVDEQTFDKAMRYLIVYEQIWQHRPELLKDRICTLIGKNQRIHGRLCKINKITQLEANEFFTNYHFLGSVKSPFRYGLYFKGNMVAAALFSKARTLKNGLRSAELLRFACKSGFSVNGGLSKLLINHCRERNIGHLMTYVDKDWGNGQGFMKLGFRVEGFRKPDAFWLDPKTNKIFRTREFAALLPNPPGFIKFNNGGSIRLTLTLSDNHL